MAFHYDLLAAEILKDPEGLGYAGKPAADVAALLNASTRRRPKPLEERMTTYRTVAHLIGLPTAAAIKSALETAAGSNAALAMALEWLHPHAQGIDPCSPATVKMLGILVAQNVLSEQNRDALIAHGYLACSRADELGLPRVLPGHILKAIPDWKEA